MYLLAVEVKSPSHQRETEKNIFTHVAPTLSPPRFNRAIERETLHEGLMRSSILQLGSNRWSYGCW